MVNGLLFTRNKNLPPQWIGLLVTLATQHITTRYKRGGGGGGVEEDMFVFIQRRLSTSVFAGPCEA